MKTVQRVGSRSMLSDTHPTLTSEFVHCVCDGERCDIHNPSNISRGSHRRFRWRCNAGHVFDAKVGSRASGVRTTGCATCSGASRPGSNPLLAVSHPDVHAKAIECRGCGNCSRDTVTTGNKCRWLFQCTAGHAFEALMYNMVRGTAPCRACTRSLLVDSNIADEFVTCVCSECLENETPLHDTTNLTQGSGRPALWQCRSCDHQWTARIPDRHDSVYPTGCPECAPQNESKREHDIMSELAGLIKSSYTGPERVNGWRYPVDFTDPVRKVVVQYDAWYWHKERTEIDARCASNLEDAGWYVIRVREHPLPRVHHDEIVTTQHEPSTKLAARIAERVLAVSSNRKPD